MIQIVELLRDRIVSTGQIPHAERRYIVSGTTSDVEARQSLSAHAPTLFDPWGDGLVFLPRVDVTVESLSEDMWLGGVAYGTIPQQGEIVRHFTTQGGTEHVFVARRHIASYAPPGATAPDYKGAINGGEGLSIGVAVFMFKEVHYKDAAFFTPQYRAQVVFPLTYTVNDRPFRGFARGEVLFMGAAARQQGDGKWEVQYDFAAARNREGVTIGDITGINKKGWQYLWVDVEEAEDNDAARIVAVPSVVSVEEVYPEANFGLLGIGE